MKIKKRYYVLLAVSVVLGLVVAWIAYGNTDLEINEFEIKSEKIPSGFNNFRIAQVSDLHNTEIGTDNEKLISMLKKTDADIIAITGDIIDSSNTDIDIALAFAKEAVNIAPTYFVNGNHEAWSGKYDVLRQGFVDYGVTILENESIEIKVGEDVITLIGITDPAFPVAFYDDAKEQSTENQLLYSIPDSDTYKVLLAHRPEYFSRYTGKVDLVLSGHAHGGQFILPFVGGVVAPGQGLFPQYYQGLYTMDGTDMIVSRGIGNSVIPFRINNNPEIVVAELERIGD